MAKYRNITDDTLLVVVGGGLVKVEPDAVIDLQHQIFRQVNVRIMP